MTPDLRLDDPRRSVIDLQERLRSRVAAVLGVPADRIVLSPTPEALALAGFDRDQAIPVGRADNPVSALVTDTSVEQARRLELALSEVALRAALDAILPVGMAAREAESARHADLLQRAADRLRSWPEIASAAAEDRRISLTAREPLALRRKLAAAGIVAAEAEEGGFTLFCPSPADAEALAERLTSASSRSALIRRTTKETDIAVSLDLDRDGPVRAETGIEFFDHMLDQIGRHGGFALGVTAEGDVGVDAHHTIEDVCLALGEALRQALGDKRGIARFGFELPMDETRAGVWIDLSGRPFCKFEGTIPGERVAGFPVEMTPHAFRSLAEAMKASIHVRVDGENAHHMIEACFKAFGRALRQAIRVEGDAIPSTKGAL
ncbi:MULTISPECIES: imidazoleglycerol-phosphate dehydratase HisB [Hyphobacterium]|uniref:Imidazoleglycerol-phosphate dehydratase n=1 Tax=Hyphobacterium vulgare TaxID=1736751 RepID=A0ABV6ZTL5_9PROT